MRLCTLGGLRVEGVAFNRPKPLLLLAYVALEGSKTRRHLADLFFIDARDSRDSLSTTLARLREHLGDKVCLEKDRVSTGVECDAQELLGLSDRQEFGGALELYRGSFLDGFDLTLGEELEEWVFSMREQLALRVREALLQCAEMELTRGQLARACAHTEAALKLPGAPELEAEAYARTYNLLVAGRSPLAKRVLKEASALGLVLEQPTQPYNYPSQASKPHTTPFDVPTRKLSFVGRGAERTELRRMLADPECHLITLHGPGGVGKSRLAIQSAYDQREFGGFSDGIFFVPLDGLTSRDEVVARLGTLFGLPTGQGRDVTVLVKRIGSQTLLLILDNYEHLVDTFDVPDTLVTHCPNLKVLVTSRETLSLEQEWVLPLRGLSLPAVDPLPGKARHTDAVVLFEQRARKVKPGFSLAGQSLVSAIELCRLVEGYPLEIELAASWVHAAPLEELLVTLREDPSLLRATARDAPERHRSVEHVFEQSWGLLTATEQTAVARLSVFQGGFTRHAASRVAGVTLPLLAMLLNKSFFWLTSQGRYEQHTMLRQFACSKLAEQIEDSLIYASHCAYYDDYVQQHSAEQNAIDATGQELGNILAAATWAYEKQRFDQFVRMMYFLTKDGAYFAARGHTEGSMRLLKLAIYAAKQIGDYTSAHFLAAKAGNAHQELEGDLRQAAAAYEEALSYARLARNEHREIISLSLLGATHSYLGEPEASNLLSAAQELAETKGDALALCHVLQNRSHVASLTEAWQVMNDFAQKAAVIARKLTPSAEARKYLFFCLSNWAESEYRLGNLQIALDLRLEALKSAEQSNNEIWLGHAHYQLGDVYDELDEYHPAGIHFSRALKLYRRNRVKAFEEDLVVYLGEKCYMVDNAHVTKSEKTVSIER